MNEKQRNSIFSSLALLMSFGYSFMGIMAYFALLLGRERAMRNLSMQPLEAFEKIGLFTSDMLVGAYRVYAYVGIYGATLALII